MHNIQCTYPSNKNAHCPEEKEVSIMKNMTLLSALDQRLWISHLFVYLLDCIGSGKLPVYLDILLYWAEVIGKSYQHVSQKGSNKTWDGRSVFRERGEWIIFLFCFFWVLPGSGLDEAQVGHPAGSLGGAAGQGGRRGLHQGVRPGGAWSAPSQGDLQMYCCPSPSRPPSSLIDVKYVWRWEVNTCDTTLMWC